MKKLQLSLIFLILSCSLLAQKSSKIENYDYLKHKYKYLDKNFKIRIPSSEFQSALLKHNMPSERIKSYRDSIAVVMFLEFTNNDAIRIATFKVGYQWERLAYHMLSSPSEAKIMAESLNISHPWSMKEFLSDDSNKSPIVISFFYNLKKKIAAIDKTKNLNVPREELLSIAMRINPERIVSFENLKKQRKGSNNRCNSH